MIASSTITTTEAIVAPVLH